MTYLTINVSGPHPHIQTTSKTNTAHLKLRPFTLLRTADVHVLHLHGLRGRAKGFVTMQEVARPPAVLYRFAPPKEGANAGFLTGCAAAMHATWGSSRAPRIHFAT